MMKVVPNILRRNPFTTEICTIELPIKSHDIEPLLVGRGSKHSFVFGSLDYSFGELGVGGGRGSIQHAPYNKERDGTMHRRQKEGMKCRCL
jgi:hypothetical protein